MKKIFLLIILIFFIGFNSESNTKSKTSSWGYILHTSRLDIRYLETTIPAYDVISITGFMISRKGTLEIESSPMRANIYAIARKHGTKVYPLFSFKSASIGHVVLHSSQLREKAAQSIIDYICKQGFPGIHLDFEYLPPEDSEQLAQLLSYLKKYFHGKISMAIFPQVDFPEKWSQFHDLGKISSYLDEIVIMCYDYHGPHTGPGPVTDIRWAEKNIRATMCYKKPENIWLGIPSYGYQWSGKKVAVITARYGSILAKKYNGHRDTSGTITFSFVKANQPYTAYIADKQTRSQLFKLAGQYHLAGSALWRLGFEE